MFFLLLTAPSFSVEPPPPLTRHEARRGLLGRFSSLRGSVILRSGSRPKTGLSREAGRGVSAARTETLSIRTILGTPGHPIKTTVFTIKVRDRSSGQRRRNEGRAFFWFRAMTVDCETSFGSASWSLAFAVPESVPDFPNDTPCANQMMTTVFTICPDVPDFFIQESIRIILPPCHGAVLPRGRLLRRNDRRGSSRSYRRSETERGFLPSPASPRS